MKLKLTKLEKAWILYDVGNSAFILLVSTIMPIYFNYLGDLAGLSSVDYLAYWGYGTSISTLIVALLGPVLGTVADTRNYKKKLFTGAMLIGAISCVLLGLASTWLVFLIIFVIAKVGYSASLIFYDAMLTDITTENRMDTVSSHGYAWGYIGSCIPFGIGLVLVLGGSSFGLSMPLAMSLTFAMIAIWWVVMSLPLLRRYQQKFYVDHPSHIFQNSLGRLWNTLKKAQKNKKILWFLLAFFFYIDGVYTIIDMATAYGQALGLDSTGLLIALLMTQIVAFPCSITFGRLSKKYDPKQLITICILAYTGIAIFALFMSTQLHFWILAFIVGMFQGGIQALSRSYFAKIIPNENAGEYFGIMDICGKGASFLGTAIISIASQVTGNINIGVGMLTILFILGLLFFRKSAKLA
ncbi:MAG TPA: MFS transporter [Candidatus Fimiplasma intestinipullorum]|uniref:MFS transporter n=1 Tax=Candidatus Fimiplasma intestinipullorum TaxID=2840825 RepID=A0A9D1L042_9FIRM|nr:MFS transporter [Candidatus Fimiplasma intestinipullorum]